MPDRTLTDAQIEAYLARFGATRPAVADRTALDDLHIRHLLGIPFENLAIHLGDPIRLGLDDVFAKVVGRRRGGYCFELNSLFGALLRSLGFGVDLLAARVARETGDFGHPFEHLTLAVTVPDGDRVLADVGFGESFIHPVPLIADRIHHDRGHRVRLVRAGDGWVYEDDRDGDWTQRYTFDDANRDLEEFDEMNEWQQTSPDSHFTQQVICSRATDRGRVTVSDRRLIVREDDTRSEQPIDDPTATIRERFGIELTTPLP